MHVGPKVLAHVVPEVAESCAPWREQTTVLIRFISATLQLEGELKELEEYSTRTANELEQALSESAGGTFSAKKRLQLERRVLSLAPELSSLVEHLEILAEATWARGLSLPLSELLCSRPERGSDRPFLSLPVRGAATAVEVTVPPRMGLRALGVLAGVHHRPHLGLRLSVSASSVTLTMSADQSDDGSKPEFYCHLPAIRPIPPSTAVAGALFRHYGGEVKDGGRVVILPARVAD